jgi:uncharacterized membrane protein
MNYLNFLYASILFFVLDFIWIYSNLDFYLNLVLKIQNEPFVIKIPTVIIAYIFIMTTLYFCIRFIELEVKNKDYLKIFLYSALFGLSVYGVFSFTTCAMFKNYSYYNAILDSIWAVVLYSTSSLLYFYL